MDCFLIEGETVGSQNLHSEVFADSTWRCPQPVGEGPLRCWPGDTSLTEEQPGASSLQGPSCGFIRGTFRSQRATGFCSTMASTPPCEVFIFPLLAQQMPQRMVHLISRHTMWLVRPPMPFWLESCRMSERLNALECKFKNCRQSSARDALAPYLPFPPPACSSHVSGFSELLNHSQRSGALRQLSEACVSRPDPVCCDALPQIQC